MNEAAFMEQVAAAVRSARHRQGLAQEELAMAAGVSTRTVHKIENAHPTVRVDSALKVLDALGIVVRLDDPGAA